MSEKTIFKKIIDKEIPADIVYEDELFIAILDINPVTKGHSLLIPKEQYVWIQDLPDELLGKTFIKAKSLIQILKQATSCDYVQVVVEGIAVPHFHIHLIPSWLGNENATWKHVQYENEEKEILKEKIIFALK